MLGTHDEKNQSVYTEGTKLALEYFFPSLAHYAAGI